MSFAAQRRIGWPCQSFLMLVLAIVLSGCTGGRQSESQALDEYFKNNPKSNRESVA